MNERRERVTMQVYSGRESDGTGRKSGTKESRRGKEGVGGEITWRELRYLYSSWFLTRECLSLTNGDSD